MNAKRTDISQIRKYLNGELNAAAMHKLEREAQDDPFLMEALEGYEADLTKQYPETDLDHLLQQRVASQKTRKIIPWKYYAAAAAILIVILLGYEAWFNKLQPTRTKLTASSLPAPADHALLKKDTAIVRDIKADKQSLVASNIPVPQHTSLRPELKPAASPLQAAVTNANTPAVYKADTVEYKASDYKVHPNPTLDELLKKMKGTEVGADGSVTQQGQSVTKVKINGKDYASGNVQQAIKNLPADIIEKAQVVDDYGDQAARAGIKGKKDSVALNEVTVAGYATLKKTDITTGNGVTSQALQGKVRGADVTTPTRISGIVYNDLGLALPGVNVLLNGTRNNAVTDDKGRFSIPVNGQAATLIVRSLGYESAQVKANVNDSLQIKLKPSNMELNEVVVVGYGNTKKVITLAHPRIGWDKYNKYLKSASVGETSGTVSLSFTVSSQGQLSDFRVTKGISDGINQQAISLVKNGPAWDGDTSGEPKTIKLKVRFAKK